VRYLLLVCTDSSPDAGQPSSIEDWFAYVSDSGVWQDGDRLRPAKDGKTVRVRHGDLLVTDESSGLTETVVGFDILDCKNLDEAIQVASKHPMARGGKLELRPVWPFDDQAAT
jgi:hypothetical protein